MRRILQCEMDSRYFHLYGEVFIKSFYEHNTGWELYVADIGLTPEDREIAQRYTKMPMAKYDKYLSSRWPNLAARMQSVPELLQNYDVVLRVDPDSLIMRSYDKLLEEFVPSPAHITAPRLPHTMAEHTRHLGRAAEIYGVSEAHPCFHTRAMTMCFTLMKGTPEILDTFSWIWDNWDELISASKEEEPIFSAAIYKRNIPYYTVPWSYFWSAPCYNVEARNIIPSLAAVSVFNDNYHAVHFSYGKYFVRNTAGGRMRENWAAWEDVYRSYYCPKPWPDPDEVCGFEE